MMPVHAIVKTFAFSIVPHVTITGGRGESIVPGFHDILAIFTSCNLMLHQKDLCICRLGLLLNQSNLILPCIHKLMNMFR